MKENKNIVNNVNDDLELDDLLESESNRDKLLINLKANNKEKRNQIFGGANESHHLNSENLDNSTHPMSNVSKVNH